MMGGGSTLSRQLAAFKEGITNNQLITFKPEDAWVYLLCIMY